MCSHLAEITVQIEIKFVFKKLIQFSKYLIRSTADNGNSFLFPDFFSKSTPELMTFYSSSATPSVLGGLPLCHERCSSGEQQKGCDIIRMATRNHRLFCVHVSHKDVV